MNIKTKLAALFVAATCAVSCSDDDSSTPSNPGNFILAVTPAASTGVADYLLTASSLDTGSISTARNGVEQDGTYRYYVTHNDKFFSMLYGQGNPGAVTAYDIQDGALNKLTNFQTETVQSFAPVNDDLLLVKISRNLASPTSTWYKVNTESLTITSEGAVNTLDVTGDLGELAHFTWIKQVGDKVYAPYQTIKDRSFNTDYPDQAWIAVFNYADMSLDKVIEDDRTSFIGRYFMDGLSIAENGDIYAFSPSAATTDGVLSSTKPSAVTRIKANTTEFDKSYYFDVEEASGGNNITSWLYVGNNNYIVHSQAKSERTSFPSGRRVAIVNVVDKTYDLVTGLPAFEDILSLTTNNYTPKDGRTGYIGVNLKDGSSYVYKIDVATKTATEGLKVEGGTLTAIQHLD
ncbi:DUF4374 domain-containing protein [Dawidia soli]|uniref:DUF4374 domain-containing protein n=1 Tax=Dawidia soli TaxID=2782352 RepID=A0AAP2DC41_9BACT|nr:DUF4374 domain-containing protein [Dawidia soli]MBT1689313.1 DUF4374 domain-containing protein [Dawidia soli]